MLASLHALPVPVAARRRPTDEAATVERWAALLTTIRPDLSARVEPLRDWIMSELEARTAVAGPIHADFHHTNVLVDGETITFIDLDELAAGDPLVDVGRFLASLRIPALRAHGRLDGLAAAGDAFLEAYLRATNDDVARARLFEAAALFIAGASAFRIQRPNWVQETDLLLTEAERVATLARTRTSRPAASAPIDRVTWMLDDTYMRAVLDPHLRAAYGDVDVTGCRARLRAETSREYRLEYTLSGWKGNDRWKVRLEGLAPVEANRGGRSAARRLNELREAFHGCAEALVLPRPIAYISPLTLLVLEVPEGVPFSALASTTDGTEAAAVVARALAALHRAPVVPSVHQSTDAERLALERDVRALRDARPDLHPQADRLAATLSHRLRRLPAREAPTLRPAHPRRLLCADGRVGLAGPAGLAAAHPLADVASLLARIRLIGVQTDRTADAERTGARLRQAALDLERVESDELDSLEACALIRLARTEASVTPDGRAADELLRGAEVSLGR